MEKISTIDWKKYNSIFKQYLEPILHYQERFNECRIELDRIVTAIIELYQKQHVTCKCVVLSVESDVQYFNITLYVCAEDFQMAWEKDRNLCNGWYDTIGIDRNQFRLYTKLYEKSKFDIEYCIYDAVIYYTIFE